MDFPSSDGKRLVLVEFYELSILHGCFQKYFVYICKPSTTFFQVPHGLYLPFLKQSFLYYPPLLKAKQTPLKKTVLSRAWAEWYPRTPLVYSNFSSSSKSGSTCFLEFPTPARLSHFISASKFVFTHVDLQEHLALESQALAFHSGQGNASHHRHPVLYDQTSLQCWVVLAPRWFFCCIVWLSLSRGTQCFLSLEQQTEECWQWKVHN